MESSSENPQGLSPLPKTTAIRRKLLQQPVQTIAEPEGLQPLYANFWSGLDTPEELVLDFGLNPWPFEVSPHPIKISNDSS